MCVEACPCDAIRMDTYVHPRIWGYRREDFVETKEILMERSRVLAERGRDALMDDCCSEATAAGRRRRLAGGSSDPAGRSGDAGCSRRADRREAAATSSGSRRDPLAALAALSAVAQTRASRGSLVSPRYARGVARWLEYRMNLFDGIEG